MFSEEELELLEDVIIKYLVAYHSGRGKTKYVKEFAVLDLLSKVSEIKKNM